MWTPVISGPTLCSKETQKRKREKSHQNNSLLGKVDHNVYKNFLKYLLVNDLQVIHLHLHFCRPNPSILRTRQDKMLSKSLTKPLVDHCPGHRRWTLKNNWWSDAMKRNSVGTCWNHSVLGSLLNRPTHSHFQVVIRPIQKSTGVRFCVNEVKRSMNSFLIGNLQFNGKYKLTAQKFQKKKRKKGPEFSRLLLLGCTTKRLITESGQEIL